MRRVLVFRHGIVINRYFMLAMERYFARRGWDVRNRSYPSTRKFVEEHARDLSEELLQIDQQLTRQGEPHEIYVVTHSLGGLVLRYALTHFAMPPIRRAVLMVPPNNGSIAARFFRNFPPYRWIFGTKAGSQLSADLPGIFVEAGVPEGTDIGIIAGTVPRRRWPTPLEQPHDGVVTVAEMRLDAFPLKALPHGHTMILFSRYAWEEVESFLDRGNFLKSTTNAKEASRA